MKAETLVAYIDGFNLYHGLKDKGWSQYYWMDIDKLCLNLLKKDQYLRTVHYFTARIRGNPQKQRRQSTFLEALQATGISPIRGKYRLNTFECHGCHYVHEIPAEKMTDVSIAVQMLIDAHYNRYDTALLISGDTDLVPAVKAIKENFRDKKVVMAFPPERYCSDFEPIADGCLVIDERICRRSQLPDAVLRDDGFQLKKPSEWT